MNIKLRLQNKTTLIALLVACTSFTYQILGILNITAPISEDSAIQAITIIANLILGLGILVDPTTKGIKDSKKARNYHKPM